MLAWTVNTMTRKFVNTQIFDKQWTKIGLNDDDLKRLETRIEVGSSDIDFEVETDDNGIEILYAVITYKVKIYQTTYTSRIDLGEVRT